MEGRYKPSLLTIVTIKSMSGNVSFMCERYKYLPMEKAVKNILLHRK